MLNKSLLKPCRSIVLVLIFVAGFSNNAFGIDKNSQEAQFLLNMKTFRTDFIQKQYMQKGVEITDGKILIKKPNSILLEHNGKQMRLKIVSIDGNLKMIDKDINQTTYVDNQYGELMQFFTNNLKPEKLFFNSKKETCLQFNFLDTPWYACVAIDVKNKLLKGMSLYASSFDEKDIKNQKDEKKISQTISKVLDVEFKNQKIDGKVADDEFYIKDSRIFDDEDEN